MTKVVEYIIIIALTFTVPTLVFATKYGNMEQLLISVKESVDKIEDRTYALTQDVHTIKGKLGIE